MSKTIHTTAILSVLGTAGAAPTSPDPAPPRETITLKLEQIEEVRRTDFTTSSDSGFTMFETPGLELRFAIQAPAGRHIIEVKQPATLDAVDSMGTDLSVLPPSDFGQARYVETVSLWEKPPHELTFRLALPARDAEHFSLTSRMDAITYLDLETGTLILTPQWQPVPAGLFGDAGVRVRAERKRGNVHVAFQPGTVREMIESVTLRQSGTPLGHEGAMWNDLQAGYMFTVGPDASGSDDFTAEVQVRRGLKSLPIRIEIREMPLP